LPNWLQSLKERFEEAAKDQPNQFQALKVLLEPTQQAIGQNVYEVAFIADTDGLPLEFIRRMND
jgi:hypothetical protein